jgi:hypothetical protein
LKYPLKSGDTIMYNTNLVDSTSFDPSLSLQVSLGGIDENLMWWTTLAKPQ